MSLNLPVNLKAYGHSHKNICAFFAGFSDCICVPHERLASVASYDDTVEVF